MPINGHKPGMAPRLLPAGITAATRRTLLSLLIATLPAALFVARTDAAENAAGPAPDGAEAPGHAMLFNEDLNSQGQQYSGAVTWRIDRIAVAGAAGEVVVHGDVAIPDFRMRISLDFRRNTDKSLPASHVMELTFVMPQDVGDHEVMTIPGMLMKFTAQGRGAPLAGQAAKISKGLFWVGLSNVAADREHNLQLLKERQWIDVPMVYANQHRAILAIEKGSHGEEIFNEAMREWDRLR